MMLTLAWAATSSSAWRKIGLEEDIAYERPVLRRAATRIAAMTKTKTPPSNRTNYTDATTHLPKSTPVVQQAR